MTIYKLKPKEELKEIIWYKLKSGQSILVDYIEPNTRQLVSSCFNGLHIRSSEVEINNMHSFVDKISEPKFKIKDKVRIFGGREFTISRIDFDGGSYTYTFTTGEYDIEENLELAPTKKVMKRISVRAIYVRPTDLIINFNSCHTSTVNFADITNPVVEFSSGSALITVDGHALIEIEREVIE